jgi:hypothetical protein
MSNVELFNTASNPGFYTRTNSCITTVTRCLKLQMELR